MGKRPAPCLGAEAVSQASSAAHLPHPLPLQWPFCVCCSSPPSRENSSRREVRQKGHAANCYSERNQEPSFRKRGKCQDSEGQGQRRKGTWGLQGLRLSQLLPPSSSGRGGRSGFQALSPLPCLFWLHVRACLMENKTKEVIS